MSVVKKTPRAEEDLYGIWHYIAVENQNPINAERFIDEIDAAMQRLAQMPTVGIRKDHYLNGLYQSVFGDYLIFYLPIENGIEIVRVIHGAREVENLF